MRWMYCRQQSGGEHQLRPGPAEELRSKFTLKLWNTYALLLQLRPARRLRSRRAAGAGARSGPTSTAGFCRICNS